MQLNTALARTAFAHMAFSGIIFLSVMFSFLIFLLYFLVFFEEGSSGNTRLCTLSYSTLLTGLNILLTGKIEHHTFGFIFSYSSEQNKINLRSDKR
jgi:hypothetical protein